MQVNFKEYFKEDDLLTGNVLRLINETQKNINNNNEKEIKKNENHYGRLSLVCYLRKGMIKCQHIN